jgi:type IV secretion system protein VirD4
MQLPPDDEIVMVSGVHPLRAKKARYYKDKRFTERLLPAPASGSDARAPRDDDWSKLPLPMPVVIGDAPNAAALKEPTVAENPNTAANDRPADAAPPDEAEPAGTGSHDSDDDANAGLRREPGLEAHKDIAPEREPELDNEFEPDERPIDADTRRANAMFRELRARARQRDMDIGF